MSDTSPKDHWAQSLSPDLLSAFFTDMQGSPVTSGGTYPEDAVLHSRYADHATNAGDEPMLAGANEEQGSVDGTVLYDVVHDTMPSVVSLTPSRLPLQECSEATRGCSLAKLKTDLASFGRFVKVKRPNAAGISRASSSTISRGM